MKGLAYIDDLNWVSDILGFSERYDLDVDAITHARPLAEKLRDYFDNVYTPSIDVFNSQAMSRVLESLEIDGYDIVLTPATQKGRIVAGMAGGILKSMVYTDVISVDMDNMTLERLVYGGLGKALISFKLPSVLCIVKGVWKGAGAGNAQGSVKIIDVGDLDLKVEYIKRSLEGADPSKAELVIGAGRGFKSRDDLKMVDELSRLLGGAWSVTRPLSADYGWCSHWIGISGLIINPKVYLVFGSSGQPHHMLGARGSKVIIAVNKDESAPIFQESDLGIVGDLYKILPRLIERIKEIRGL